MHTRTVRIKHPVGGLYNGKPVPGVGELLTLEAAEAGRWLHAGLAESPETKVPAKETPEAALETVTETPEGDGKGLPLETPEKPVQRRSRKRPVADTSAQV